MLSEQALRAELDATLKDKEIAEQQLQLLQEQMALLQRQEEALLVLLDTHEKIAANEQRTLALQQQIGPSNGNKPANGNKPDVQIIEELFKELGPMHVADVVKHAQAKGVAFAGAKPPQQMARDKLANSKRFVLFSNNVWGLLGQSPDKSQTVRFEDVDDLPF